MSALNIPWEIPTTPPDAEGTEMQTARIEASQDVSKSSVPITIAAALLIGAIGATSGYWAGQSGTAQNIKDVQSDLKLIVQQMKSADDLQRVQSEFNKSLASATKDEMTEIKRQVQLLQVQYQQIQLALAKGK